MCPSTILSVTIKEVINEQSNCNAQRQKAIATIRDYVENCGGCYERHEASVGVSVRGKDQHGIRMVSVEVTDDNAKVIIEDLYTICDHRTNIFTPENATFSIINKTLQIRPIDSLCGRIVIEVTDKKQ